MSQLQAHWGLTSVKDSMVRLSKTSSRASSHRSQLEWSGEYQSIVRRGC